MGQQERMPQEWKCGKIISIHKKGERRLCNNYRGITLLNPAHRILSTLIQRRLVETTKDTEQ